MSPKTIITEKDKRLIKKVLKKLKKDKIKRKTKKLYTKKEHLNHITVGNQPNIKPISHPQHMAYGTPNDKNDAQIIKRLDEEAKYLKNELRRAEEREEHFKRDQNIKIEEVQNEIIEIKRGRPKGSKNKSTIEMEAKEKIADEHYHKKLKEKAFNGLKEYTTEIEPVFNFGSTGGVLSAHQSHTNHDMDELFPEISFDEFINGNNDELGDDPFINSDDEDNQRSLQEVLAGGGGVVEKKKRGRKPGSKNKPKDND